MKTRLSLIALSCLSLGACVTYTSEYANDGYYSSPRDSTADYGDNYYGSPGNYGSYSYYGAAPVISISYSLFFGYSPYGHYGYGDCRYRTYCSAYLPGYGWGYWPNADYRPHYGHHPQHPRPPGKGTKPPKPPQHRPDRPGSGYPIVDRPDGPRLNAPYPERPQRADRRATAPVPTGGTPGMAGAPAPSPAWRMREQTRPPSPAERAVSEPQRRQQAPTQHYRRTDFIPAVRPEPIADERGAPDQDREPAYRRSGMPNQTPVQGQPQTAIRGQRMPVPAQAQNRPPAPARQKAERVQRETRAEPSRSKGDDEP